MYTIQTNEGVIRDLYKESLNKRNIGSLQDLVSMDFVGLKSQKEAAGSPAPTAALIAAFPDIQWYIDDLFAKDDKVVVRWKWKGTQTGPYQQIAPTGKKVTNEGMAIFEMKDGKIIKYRLQTDPLAFLQKLGVLPHDIAEMATKKDHKGTISLIDRFFVPAAAKTAFYERMNFNRRFIKKLPGFIEDAVYEYTTVKDGNLTCLTVVKWVDREALDNARREILAEYKKQGFDAAEMLIRLNISAERAIYTEV